MKDTQLKEIIKKIKTDGFITRNWALKRYISRLGAYMCLLKKNKYKFSTGYIDNIYGDGKDFIYILKR